jgi:hypothetical protein
VTFAYPIARLVYHLGVNSLNPAIKAIGRIIGNADAKIGVAVPDVIRDQRLVYQYQTV